MNYIIIIPTFRRNILPTSLGSKSKTSKEPTQHAAWQNCWKGLRKSCYSLSTWPGFPKSRNISFQLTYIPRKRFWNLKPAGRSSTQTKRPERKFSYCSIINNRDTEQFTEAGIAATRVWTKDSSSLPTLLCDPSSSNGRPSGFMGATVITAVLRETIGSDHTTSKFQLQAKKSIFSPTCDGNSTKKRRKFRN